MYDCECTPTRSRCLRLVLSRMPLLRYYTATITRVDTYKKTCQISIYPRIWLRTRRGNFKGTAWTTVFRERRERKEKDVIISEMNAVKVNTSLRRTTTNGVKILSRVKWESSEVIPDRRKCYTTRVHIMELRSIVYIISEEFYNWSLIEAWSTE